MNLMFQRDHQPASIDHVVQAEKYLGVSLPGDYRDFLLRQNGGRYPTRDILIYTGADDIEVSTSIPDFFGIACNTDRNLIAQYDFYSRDERIPNGVLPIARDIAGNLICMEIGGLNAGRVYFWDHELELEKEGHNNLSAIADSFSSFVAALKKEDE